MWILTFPFVGTGEVREGGYTVPDHEENCLLVRVMRSLNKSSPVLSSCFIRVVL